MGYQDNDRLYTCFPLHHSLASMMGVASTFQVGGCVVVDERFSASRYWQRVEASEATLGHILDPMVPMLMSQPDFPSDRNHRCRELWTAFNHPDFEERFNVKLHQHYSMTEMAPIAYRRRDEASVPAGSCGKVGELFDLRVVDENEYPVGPGTHGEILARPNYPHTTMAGYFGNDAATAAAWRGLWYHTGDEGYVDADGYLYLVGRIGDQIRRRGVNISAEHIEDAARSHPSVIDAAAIAIPAEFGESEIKLVLMTALPAAPPGVDEILSHLTDRLPREMVPRFIEWRADFPRTGTQKINKSELRKEGQNGITASTLDLTGRLASTASTATPHKGIGA
jgi:crotonobetaine/carnitine-CoA ligase